jgi:transglutaminase-like putative cysteine protease
VAKYLQNFQVNCLRLAAAFLTIAGTGCGAGDTRVMTPPPAAPTTQPAAILPAPRAAGESRSFVIHYAATIKKIPPGVGRLDLWLPVPPANAGQTVADVSLKSPLQHELVAEPLYGGQVMHLWSQDPIPATVTLTFRATRRAEHALPDPEETRETKGDLPAPPDRYLQPDRLGIIDDRIRALSDQITAGHADAVSKCRAIYDYVIAHMAYDKVAPGWGRGDTARACIVGKGNCTDFHALFISLTRAQHIPARFEIGFQIPAGARSGKVEGYHCWSEFWSPQFGWVPVDCSEAWKQAPLREFYFGSLDPDRVAMSLGRDLKFPGMQGEPLNYLLSPYAELDGKPFADVEKAVSFEDR